MLPTAFRFYFAESLQKEMNGTQGTASALRALLKPSPRPYAPTARRSTGERCASAPFLRPEDTHVATRGSRKHHEAEPEGLRGCMPRPRQSQLLGRKRMPWQSAEDDSNRLSPTLRCHGTTALFSQGRGTTWRDDSKLWDRGKTHRAEHTAPSAIPPRLTPPHVILIKHTTTALR